MAFADISLTAIAAFVPAAFLAQIGDAATPMQYGEYGIVGVTVALALWSLREQSQRRIDDAKAYAEDIKAIQESRIQESRQNHETQMALLMRLLDARKE